MSLAAILFDVDGTLADTEPAGHLPAYNAAFAEFGLDWQWSQALYRELLMISGGRERIAHYLDHHKPPLGDQGQAVARDRGAWIAALHRCKSRHFRSRLEQGLVPLRPGVARLFREARCAGVSVALVTNATRATLEPFVEYALGPELASAITLTVCGDEVARKKPAGDLYLTACERLGCRPVDCIAIEDSQVGVEAASAAGIAALVVVNDDTRDQVLEKAQGVLESLGEPGAPAVVLRPPGFDLGIVDLAVLQRMQVEAARRVA